MTEKNLRARLASPPILVAPGVYDPLTEFTKLFEGVSAKTTKKDLSDLPVEERLKRHIIDGEKIGLEDNLRLALGNYAALDIINNILLPLKTLHDDMGMSMQDRNQIFDTSLKARNTLAETPGRGL